MLRKIIRWIINKIDDPIDNFKHFWHGLEICIWKRMYKCSAHMKNKPGTKWSIKQIDAFDPDANRHITIFCKRNTTYDE
jgi:hypothetical protein